MIDIRFLRENPEAVKENIRKKFQDAKLPLVDEVVDLDAKRRAAIAEVESLKAARNKLSKANGPLYGQLKKCDDEAKKAELQAQIDRNNAAVKADDRIDLLFIDIVIGKRGGSDIGHCTFMLHAGDVEIMAVVRVAGRKMPMVCGQLQIVCFSGFDDH